MKLEALLHDIEVRGYTGDIAVEIDHLAYDSRRVAHGGVFFAIPGNQSDGRSFIEDAVKRGAAAVVSPGGVKPRPGTVYVEVTDIRKAMAKMACHFYGDPSLRLSLIGVTGTNGKTTCTYLLEAVLKEAGYLTGVIGTIGYRYLDISLIPKTTTPESLDLQRLLSDMAGRGVTHAITEVSSHGIDLHRVYGCHFRCGVFTNLTRDHLDYHGTMDGYFSSKARLFTELLVTFNGRDPVAVINIDDPYGRRIRDACQVETRTYSSKGPSDYWIEGLSISSSGISLAVRTPSDRLVLNSPLLTAVNAANILAAAAASSALGIPHDAITRGIAGMASVPGRLERVWEGDGFMIFVDYAHTPDALERVLASLRPFTSGRLITVFGCGGDRDKGKRPLMGAAAGRLSDLVIVTSDNPRSEPPDHIIQDILQGIKACDVPYKKPGQLIGTPMGKRAYTSEVDRREAILLAVKIAREGDVVLVAGKGHEQVQIIGNASYPFRDQEEVVHAISSVGRTGVSVCMS